MDSSGLTPQEFQDLFNTALDRDDPPSRAWDQIDLNLHHDYLDLKQELAERTAAKAVFTKKKQFGNLTDAQDRIKDIWREIEEIDKKAVDARRARRQGMDPVLWKLSYDPKTVPNVED